MRVHVLYFAYCRDLMGRENEWMTLHDGSRAADVISCCVSTQPSLEKFKRNLLIAVNQEYASVDHILHDGDEVALFPPVSGGSSQSEVSLDRYEILRTPIPAGEIIAGVKRPEDGAVVAFEGIVRNNSLGKRTRFVEYHAYEPMALKKIREIGARLKSTGEVDAVAIVHRLGHLDIGETSVLIVVSSPHRKPAFDACHYAIDVLKKTVPIWKKEFFEDGEVWIEGDIPVKTCHET